MYWKANLQKKPEIKFSVLTISDAEALTQTKSNYDYVYHNPYSYGTYAIRKTKKEAINAIKNEFIEEIKSCKERIAELNKLKKILNDIS